MPTRPMSSARSCARSSPSPGTSETSCWPSWSPFQRRWTSCSCLWPPIANKGASPEKVRRQQELSDADRGNETICSRPEPIAPRPRPHARYDGARSLSSLHSPISHSSTSHDQVATRPRGRDIEEDRGACCVRRGDTVAAAQARLGLAGCTSVTRRSSKGVKPMLHGPTARREG